MFAALLVGWLLAASGFLCPHQACAFVELDTPFMRKFGRPDEALLTPNNTVAVDLGNTNSCIAGFDDGGRTVFRICIPSRLAALADDGALIIGEAAAAVDRPALFGLKRLIRTTRFVSDVSMGEAKRQLRIWEAAAAVFTELRPRAEAYTDRSRVYHTVLTVPYHSRDGMVMVAATLAGLRTVRLVDEPTAAAVAHGLHRSLRDRGNVLVLHVGGGTSAAAVLTYRDGGFEGLGSAHDLHLGGDDFSQRITDHLVSLMKDRHGVDATSSKDNNNGGLLRKLRMESERAKKELSRQPRAHVKVGFSNNAGAVMFFSKTLTRSEFEHLNQDLFLRVMALVDKAMRESGLDQSKHHLIDNIVLIGGSTRIPRIRQLVKSYFGGKDPVSTMAPEEVVAYGGALLGDPAVGGYQCRGRDWRQHYNSTDKCFPDERMYCKKADGGWAPCGSTSFIDGFVMAIHRAKVECFHLIKRWLETISSYFQDT